MTTLADVFLELNNLEAEGIVQRYAIGGAMAFLFYTEPARTYDLDVFVFLPPQQGLVFSMEPLYSQLQARGYSFDAEHVMMYDVPVQFLPAYNSLVTEAVEHAEFQDYNGTSVRVVGPEYLAAIAFQTGGSHRLIRAEGLIESGAVELQALYTILTSHAISRATGGAQ